MKLQWSIVGNPNNRRVQLTIDAAADLAITPPVVVSWSDLLNDTSDTIKKLASSAMVRVDSAGEDLAIQNRMIEIGGGSRALSFAELDMQEFEYQGFAAMLKTLSRVATRFQNSPTDIATMFDKWKCHHLFSRAGMARPETFLVPEPESIHSFVVSRFGSAGRVFLKPRYGSSASGVCAYIWAQNKRRLIAPIEIAATKFATVNNDSIDLTAAGSANYRLFNSLKVRSYTREHEIEIILSLLKPQQLICEAWVSKARVNGDYFDLRILVVGSEARHIVVRQSSSPMTNLHLGNQRGSLNDVISSVGQNQLDHAMSIAVQAKCLFTESLYAGVDVLIPTNGAPMVCEINAFGDLLPNVLSRGETTYQAIMKSALQSIAVANNAV